MTGRGGMTRSGWPATSWPPEPPSSPSSSPACGSPPRMPAHYARGEFAARGAAARFYGE